MMIEQLAEPISVDSDRFWNTRPFPHIYIDNVEDNFDLLVDVPKAQKSREFVHDRSEIEKAKVTKTEPGTEIEQVVFDRLTSPEFKSLVAELLGVDSVYSLYDFDDRHTFQYFHTSNTGAQLGSHVDHAMVEDKVHVLNAIYYCHKEWKEEWGGFTTLYDKTGSEVKARVRPIPNRLLLFLHTSESFHGAAPYSGPVPRKTIYMDYYVDVDQLQKIPAGLWWKHGTTFIPRTGIKGWVRYTKAYIHYRANRLAARLK